MKINSDKNTKQEKSFFDDFANWASNFTGSSWAFIGAALIVVIWAATGSDFRFF